MRVFKDFDETMHRGRRERLVVVTQGRINRFAEATGDEQYIHVDVERAKQELPIHTTIAHGPLTVSLVPEFVRSVMGLHGIKNTLNYGANRIRYLAPVPADSRLRSRISIKAADDAPPNGLRITYDITIEIEGDERPACVAEMIAVHYQ
jgi:acyl dehydratase